MRRHPARVCLLILSAALLPAACQEDGAEIEADRPGFGEPPGVVPAGIVQFESGFEYSFEGASGTRTILGGIPLVRVGTGHRVELRFGGDGFRYDSMPDGAAGRRAVRGFSDAGIGAKFNLLPEEGRRPSIGFSSTLSMPVGFGAFTSGGYDPSFRLSAEKGVPGGLTAGANVGVAVLTVEDRRFAQHLAAFSLARPVSEKWTASWEAYRIRPLGPDEPAWAMGAGLARRIGRNVQVDFSAGRSLEAGKPSWFAGYGLAVRNPVRQFFRAPATVARLARR